MQYRGRFAPSPTGPLHQGSLLTALASYLDAKHHGGKWLVRIEDLDRPRCDSAHEHSILTTLEAYGLEWDETVLRQSDQPERYEEIYQGLLNRKEAYLCDCSRADLKNRGALKHYDRFCLNKQNVSQLAAIRLKVTQTSPFEDRLLGHQAISPGGVSDFILLRRDGFIAYQLAVVVDDYDQNINQIVRGSDLLLETEKQRALQLTLNYPMLEYAHLPLVLAEDGQKLSKQTFATAIKTDAKSIYVNLKRALQRLGQLPAEPEIPDDSVNLLSYAIKHWDISKAPKVIKTTT